MDKTAKLDLIRSTGVIAIMRASSSEQLIAAADAIKAGGVHAIEVTMTTPGASAPRPTDIRPMTDITPMIIPSMVSAERSLLAASDLTAVIIESVKFIRK